MKALILTLAVLLTGCLDASRTVNVAPSAEPQMEAILAAVDALNEAAGGDAFTVRSVSSSERIDGEIIVRSVEDMGEGVRGLPRDGNCTRTRKGVIVTLRHGVHPSLIAHVLLHAAGVDDHHADPANLMHEVVPRRWTLTYEQTRAIWSAR